MAGAELGIAPDSSIEFDADADGVFAVQSAVGSYISEIKTGARRGFSADDRLRAKKSG